MRCIWQQLTVHVRMPDLGVQVELDVAASPLPNVT